MRRERVAQGGDDRVLALVEERAREAHALSPHALDLLCLVGVGGVYAAAVLYRMAQHPVVAVGDPRLDRSAHFENA